MLTFAHHLRHVSPFIVFLVGFFLFLTVGLFLGDGKQALIDTFGAGFTISLFIYAKTYCKKNRNIPIRITILWWSILAFYAIRTVFSDDVGYSITATIRMIIGYLTFSLFYEYFEEQYKQLFVKGLILFSLVAELFAALLFILPSQATLLPLMNLLYANYGHNYLANVLVFVYPILLVSVLRKTDLRVMIIFVLTFIALFFSFSRGAQFLIGLYTIFQLGIVRPKKISLQFISAVIVGLLFLFSLIFFSLLTTMNLKENTLIDSHIAKQAIKSPLVNEGRIQYWLQAVETIKERPLFGSGPGTFFLLSKHFQKGPNEYSWFAHNFFLETVSEIGIIGAIPLFTLVFILFFSKNVVRLQNSPYNNALLMGIILTFIYSFIDFTLNFLVIWILVWATLGVIIKENSSPKIRVFSSLQGIAVLCIVCYYLISIVNLLSDNFHISSTSPMQLMLTVYDAQATQTKIEQLSPHVSIPYPYILIIEWFHKNNPSVLSSITTADTKIAVKDKIALFKHITSLDPFNVTYWNNYFLYVKDKDKSEVAIMLRSLINTLDPATESFNTSLYPSPQEGTFFATQITQNTLFPDPKYMKNNFLRIYYLLGFFSLQTNPSRAEQFWILARDSNPECSYPHVELAALSTQLGNSQKAQEYLRHCLTFSNARNHCEEILNSSIPTPGFLKKNILAIPNILLD